MSAVVFLVGLILGAIAFGSAAYCDFLSEAVKNGKAEFYLDANNKRRWRWKP